MDLNAQQIKELEEIRNGSNINNGETLVIEIPDEKIKKYLEENKEELKE